VFTISSSFYILAHIYTSKVGSGSMKLYFKITLLAAILILLISGCVKQTPKDEITADLNKQFQLKINQTAFIESEDIEVKFLDVKEDSRCPSDVVCVWAGRVAVLLNTSIRDQASSITLVKGPGSEDIEYFDGYSIRLISVEPYPATTKRIQPSDYTATFIVSKTT